MKKLNPTIETEKRGRYIDIFICYDEMDSFGKIDKLKILFDTVLPYEIEKTLLQAKNLINSY